MSGSYAKNHNNQSIRFADIKNFQPEKNLDKYYSVFNSVDFNGNFDSGWSFVIDLYFRPIRFEFSSAFNFSDFV